MVGRYTYSCGIVHLHPRAGRCLASDPVWHLLRRHRPGDAITLGEITAQVEQPAAMLHRLHPFGDHPTPKRLGKPDDALDNRQRLGVRQHLTHERLIDLQQIHRQALEVGQRGAALLRSQNNCLISINLIVLLCAILRKIVL